MKHLLCRDGGFVVCSDAGNWAYAYPTSAHATSAKRQPEAVARIMAAEADDEARYCSPDICTNYNAIMSEKYLAETGA